MDLARCFDLIADVTTGRALSAPEQLGPEERAAVLDLARVVAHAVERSAAPLACYAVGRVVAQADPADRLALARALIERIAAETPSGSPAA
jgi:hypothetical protein